MISDTITQKIGEAMKAKDQVRLSTLKMLSSALNYEYIAKQHRLTEEEELAVVKKEAKKRKDAIEIYEKIGQNERAEKENEELAILKEYLPEEIDDNSLEQIVIKVVKETQATSIADMGKVIGLVMSRVSGRADGAKVAALVKAKLSA